MNKVIFHVDLNAFFASAEIIRRPEIADKAVVIAGKKSRAAVTTASYVARSYGIVSGESVSSAMKKCKDLVVIDVDYQYYVDISRRFFDFLYTYTNNIEIASIDECYMDVTDIIQNYQYPLDLAIEIQKRTFETLQLNCSIGVSYNRFLAKMASDMKKPKGITIIRDIEIETKLWPLDISKMFGIGKKTYQMMQNLNIYTIGDLANYDDITKLSMVLGSNTLNMINKAKGIDNTPLTYESEHKSFSQSLTYEYDQNDFDIMLETLKVLSNNLSKRMQKHHKCGSHLQLSIRYDDYSNINKSKILPFYTNSAQDIFEYTITLFDEIYNDAAIRLLRITMTNLKDQTLVNNELNLFNL